MVKSFLKLHVPVLKSINNSLITARFARGLGVLISSGILVLDSMEIIGKLMENVYFEKKFSYAIDEVKRGKRIARSIDNIKFFPKMLIEMILVGENTGSLEIVLEKTADYYDDQLEKTIAKATASIEPVLILFAGFIIAVVILGVFFTNVFNYGFNRIGGITMSLNVRLATFFAEHSVVSTETAKSSFGTSKP